MRVHRNLHAARAGKPQWVETQRGRVVRYLRSLTLTDVSTRIQPAAAAKCKAEGVRRVCAFFDGTEAILANRSTKASDWQRIDYDPRNGQGFTAANVEWTHAEAVHLRDDGAAFVLNPTNPTQPNLFGNPA